MSRVAPHMVLRQYELCKQSGILSPEDTSFIYYDFNVLADRIGKVYASFGRNFRHTVAVKSNPLAAVLSYIVERGFGLECASFQEVLLARRAGAQLIAWDSPVKTEEEIKASREVPGLWINADNLDELERIVRLHPKANTALRINPVVQTGSHASMSVGGTYSKFGESIAHRSEIIKQVLEAAGCVCGLHVHSSSQTTDHSKLITGIRKVVDLAREINEVRPKTITTIDIGGGFPAPYADGESYDLASFSDALRVACPELYDGSFDVITEYGRYYHANAGWTASKVEAVKDFEGKQVLLLHVGADLFLREAYQPDVWHHDVLLVDGKGIDVDTDLGGPLCFGGDYVAKGIQLQKARPGDWLIIRDTGANSFALWSRHCSRPFPTVLGDLKGLQVIRKRDTMEDILNFWT